MAHWLGRAGGMAAADVRDWLAALPAETRVGGSGPRPGCLHADHVRSGGHSGRPHTFIVGLDDARFPGAGLQDPLLLDSERARLDPDLPTAGRRLEETIQGFKRLLGRLRGTATLCWPSRDVVEDSERFPSQVVLDAFRLAARPAGGRSGRPGCAPRERRLRSRRRSRSGRSTSASGGSGDSPGTRRWPTPARFSRSARPTSFAAARRRPGARARRSPRGTAGCRAPAPISTRRRRPARCSPRTASKRRAPARENSFTATRSTSPRPRNSSSTRSAGSTRCSPVRCSTNCSRSTCARSSARGGPRISPAAAP